MNIATIEVSGVYASAKGYTHIPAGIVGATVKFDFRDDAWAGLNKTAVFRGCVTRDELITEDEVRIPSETVERAGLTLKVGVYGTDSDNNIIIPTLWADVGTIRDSTDPSGDPGTDPGLPIWAQLYEEVEKLKKNTPDNPDVPGQDGEDGGYYTPSLTQPDDNTLEFQFTPSKPDMPAVDPVQVELPHSGGNSDYTLPVATAETLGGVKPVTKTEAMTQPVGVDANGALYTEPGKGGGSDYVLPVGGDELGGVKNGGNVTINADGTMTAPENEISGEQVSSAVSDWLDAHPEATTTVADGSINPDKTTWMRQVFHNILDVSTSDVGKGFYSSSAATTGNASCSVSVAIPVTGGAVYRVVNVGNIRWLDSAKTAIGSQANNDLTDRFETAPDGAVYAMMQYVTANAAAVQVHEYIGEQYEYDTYKNLYSIVMTDPGYAKAIADIVEGKFVDGSLTPTKLFADESIRYKQMKGFDEFHWNIVNPDTVVMGTIWGNSGVDREMEDDDTTKRRRTDYIPVVEGETLIASGSIYGYDSEKVFVSGIKTTGGKLIVPEGVAYIRLSETNSAGVIPTISVFRSGYGRQLAYGSSADYAEYIPVFKSAEILEYYKAYLGIHAWADKKFGIIGDSFTAPGTWCTIMANNLKAANCWNKAISGANFCDVDGVPKTAYEQAQEFVAEGKTLDVILITMGTNDANNSRTMGEIVESNSISDFDLTTYTGGMQACLNYLQNNFPEAIIYVGWTPMGGLVNGTKAEYITRMQDVCLMYGVEYIETRTCGVTRFSDVYAECYESGANGGHPTGAGQQKIGAYMTRLMQSKL